MRKGAGVDVGDTVDISVKLDPEPRELSVPKDFLSALRAKNALKEFEELTPSRKKERIVINDAKTQETRLRRIDRIIEHILGKRKDRDNQS